MLKICKLDFLCYIKVLQQTLSSRTPMRKRNVEKQKQQSFLQGILPGLVPITLLSFFFVPDYIPGL